MRDGVVLVGMAIGASHGRTHPSGKGRVDPVGHCDITELLVIGSPFVVGLGVAVKGSGDQLVFGRLGQQVPRHLFDGELIKRQVFIEGPDDVIPIGPNGARRVIRIACRIGITGQIQPHPRPVFTELGAGKQTIYEVLISLGVLVGDECVDLLNLRGQSDQIEGHSAGKSSAVHLGR